MEDRDEHGRFIKGHKGGPGRPYLGHTLSEILRMVGEETDTETGLKNIEVLVRNLFEKAKEGNNDSVQIVLNRLFGKEPDILRIGPEEKLDLGKLSDEELITYDALLEKIVDEPDQSDQT